MSRFQSYSCNFVYISFDKVSHQQLKRSRQGVGDGVINVCNNSTVRHLSAN